MIEVVSKFEKRTRMVVASNRVVYYIIIPTLRKKGRATGGRGTVSSAIAL